MKAFLFAAVLALAPALAQAEPQAGAIDWQKRVIKVKGQGAPNPNAPNIGAARIGAERAAKADALRNILETLKGVQVTGKKNAAAVMSGDPGVQTKVQGIVKNFKVVDTRYFEDGGVEVDVEMPLDGLVDVLVPDQGGKKAEGTPGGPTGIVVDAKGVDFKPALAPRIVDDAGNEIYGPAAGDPAQAEQGLAAYASDVDAARKEARVGSAPVVVKATSSKDGDLVVSAEDAKKARDAHTSDGNVVIVLK